MFVVNANPGYVRGAPFSGAQKWHDFFFQNHSYRYVCRAGGWSQSPATSVNYVYATGVDKTVRGVVFNGYVSSYPDFPNGATTVTDFSLATNRTFVWNGTSYSTLTMQSRYLMDKYATDTVEVGTSLNGSVSMTAQNMVTTATNLTPTLVLKKLNKAGTITTLKTVVGTTQNVASNSTVTWNFNDNTTVSASIYPGEMLFVELTWAIGTLQLNNVNNLLQNDLILNLSIEYV